MSTSGCHTTVNFLIFLCLAINSAYSWDSDDLELFDLVEEVNANFYELLGVSTTASGSEIKKAYRKKTLQVHPDKNEAADAEEQFRKMNELMYNQVLETGLPDWRQPVFYYRKARKLGLVELAAVLFLIITVGHYFVMWAIYLERRLALEDFFESKRKQLRKQKRKVKVEREIAVLTKSDITPVMYGQKDEADDSSDSGLLQSGIKAKKDVVISDDIISKPTDETENSENVVRKRHKNKQKNDTEKTLITSNGSGNDQSNKENITSNQASSMDSNSKQNSLQKQQKNQSSAKNTSSVKISEKKSDNKNTEGALNDKSESNNDPQVKCEGLDAWSQNQQSSHA
ncbi:DNJC1-like protein [Mya arenaria]|uniref:DNJC1-like protein n=1 Tax=Mya arenaria TaxID=6604 RepID=A0ABY7D9T2_MYAAR|nr:DNJC1-like protein [Mya arenaria]